MRKIFLFIFILLGLGINLFAGNPDRQGTAGAGELLMNPWARSAGLHSISTSFVSGIEATRINIAGLARIEGKTEISLSRSNYLSGTGLSTNAIGFVQKVGKNSYLGLDLMTIGFGDIKVTTVANPEGTGAYYSPTWANLALSYATIFADKVSFGISFRFITESTADIKATGISIDAGAQYTNGPKNNFKLGLSLRNVGTPMKFSGEGFTSLRQTTESGNIYVLGYNQRNSNYELPTQLNIGTSYDFYFDEVVRFTPTVNFTSNSFTKDQLGVGAEISAFKDKVQLRGAYKLDLQQAENSYEEDVYAGLAVGASVNLTLNKESNSKVSLDYSYANTNIFEGTHHLGLRVKL